MEEQRYFNDTPELEEPIYADYELRWGVALDDAGAFLLGANINIGDKHAYLCVYLGFRTLIIGKDHFKKRGGKE